MINDMGMHGKAKEAGYLLGLSLPFLAVSAYLLWFIFDGVMVLGYLATGMLVVSLAAIFSTVRIISIFSFFIVCYGGVNAVAYFDFLSNGVNTRTEFLYLWITGMSLSLYIATYRIFYNKRNPRQLEYNDLKALSGKASQLRGYRLALIYIPIFLALLFLYTDVYRSGGMSNLSRDVTKEEFGIYAQFGRYFVLFSLPSLFVMGVQSSQRHKLSTILDFVLVAFFMVAIFYALRTRSYLVGPFVAYATGVFAVGLTKNRKESHSQASNETRISGKYIIIGALIVAVIVSLSGYLRFYRGVMEKGEGRVDLSVVYEKTTQSGDLGYGYTILNVMEIFDHNEIRLNGQSYYRVLFTPIPRSLWQDKPKNTQQIVGEVVGGRTDYYTLPPGAQGDAYINFGLWGIFVFVFYGIVMARLDKSFSPYSVFFAVAAFMPLYHLARGAFTNPIILMMVCFISAFLFYRWVLAKYEV